MRRAFVLLTCIAFLPAIASAASCQPWQVVIVYPRVQEVRPSQRVPPRSSVKPLRVCPAAGPRIPVQPPPVQQAVLQPRVGPAGNFISGSDEKPGIDEYALWKQTEEGRRVHEKWKRRDQDVRTREFLLNVLDAAKDGIPRKPGKTGGGEESE